MSIGQLGGSMALAGWLVGWTAIGRAEPADPPARRVPAEGLIALFESDGLAGHERAWDATAAHASIVESGALALVEELAHQGLEALAEIDTEFQIGVEGFEALATDIARDGFVLAFRQDGSIEYVLPGWAAKGPRVRFDAIARVLLAPDDDGPPKSSEVRGRTVSSTSWKPSPYFDPEARLEANWWAEGDDLILAIGPPGDWVGAILDAIEGKADNALAHPARRAIVDDPKPATFEVNGQFFIDLRALPKIEETIGALRRPRSRIDNLLKQTEQLRISPYDDFPSPPVPPRFDGGTIPPGFPLDPPSEPSRVDEARRRYPPIDLPEPPTAPEAVGPGDEDPAKRSGLDGFQTLSGRWGFDRRALRAEFLLEAPAPREGLAALLDLPGFRKDNLPPIPDGLSEFAVSTFHPGPIRDRLIELNPGLKSALEDLEAGARDLFGIDRLDDFFDRLGPTVAFYLKDDGSGEDDAKEPILLIGVRDEQALMRSLAAMAEHFNRVLAKAEGIDPEAAGADLPSLKIEALPEPDRGFELDSPSGLVRFLGDGFRPSVVVGRGYAALAGSPEAARAASTPGLRWEPDGPVGEALASLPPQLTFLHVSDPRRSRFARRIVNLPDAVQTLATAGSVGLGEDDPTPGDQILAMIGVPRRGGLRIRMDRAKVPDPSAIDAPLFPNVVAAAVDDRGLRLFVIDSVPALPPSVLLKLSVESKFGEEPKVSIGFESALKRKGPRKEPD